MTSTVTASVEAGNQRGEGWEPVVNGSGEVYQLVNEITLTAFGRYAFEVHAGHWLRMRHSRLVSELRHTLDGRVEQTHVSLREPTLESQDRRRRRRAETAMPQKRDLHEA